MGTAPLGEQPPQLQQGPTKQRQDRVWHDASVSPGMRRKIDAKNSAALYYAALSRCESAGERTMLMQLAARHGIELTMVLPLLVSCRASADVAGALEVVTAHKIPRFSSAYDLFVSVYITAGDLSQQRHIWKTKHERSPVTATATPSIGQPGVEVVLPRPLCERQVAVVARA